MDVLCARILERHRDSIRVQKPHLAVPNLTRIIGATLTLSNKHGFHATTLRQLAEASGLSMGGLYTYFDSKPTLLSMILSEVAETAAEVLTAPPASVKQDARKHLHWIIATHVRMSEAMQPWFVFSFMEAKSFPPAERQRAIEMEVMTEKIIADVLKQGVASGVFAIDQVALTASLIKPLLQDWYVKRAKYRRRGTSIEAYINAVSAFVDAAVARRTRPGRVATGRRTRSRPTAQP
ncbi:TetR/AcrR family transcriptional regulator [Bradyrhizobium embrapense]|uniref:TetR/AcrR family transcriptional regulator n=1 Tax=Bradyrhizobium embrapense TaxID=630921 RepID=UPI00067AEDC3|nr:TetR/AcrR family transcriptional regulator [Bradyrhizobium embrapense]